MKFFISIFLIQIFLGCKSTHVKGASSTIDSINKISSVNRNSDADLTSDIGESPYSFDTTLKGGYSISYRTDDSMQYLFLTKGVFSKQISSEDKTMTTKLLGFKVADFENHFILLHTLHVLGGDDPNEFELIEKTSGDITLNAAYIDSDEELNSILYFDDTKEFFGHEMFLYNVQTKKTETFRFPFEDADARLINKIRIKSLTSKFLIVTYYPNLETEIEIEKKYSR
jgi:hypothetical protein